MDCRGDYDDFTNICNLCGLAKRDLPEDLEARLPEPEPGYERVVVDNDVVLIEKATNIIKDIIKDVLKN